MMKTQLKLDFVRGIIEWHRDLESQSDALDFGHGDFRLHRYTSLFLASLSYFPQDMAQWPQMFQMHVAFMFIVIEKGQLLLVTRVMATLGLLQSGEGAHSWEMGLVLWWFSLSCGHSFNRKVVSILSALHGLRRFLDNGEGVILQRKWCWTDQKTMCPL